MMTAPTIQQSAKTLFETSVINPDGSEEKRSSSHNLILDAGMDMPPTHSWANCVRCCSVGIGTTPTSRPSGAITFAVAGTTITASAGFFISTDAGRILRINTPSRHLRITFFTDSTHVEFVEAWDLNPYPDLPGGAIGTIWYVNETGHQTEVLRTDSLSYAGGLGVAYGSSWLVDTWTHKRTFLFPVATANYLLKEIGWGPSSHTGDPLYGRAIIPGGGDSLAIGQQYKVTVSSFITFSDATAANTLSSGTFDCSGNSKVESPYLSLIASDAEDYDGGYGGRTLEPCSPNYLIRFDSSSAALESLDGLNGITLNNGDLGTRTADWLTYVGGSWKKTLKMSIAANSLNFSTLRSVYLCRASPAWSMFRTLFNAPQSADLDHSLEMTWRFGWVRDLPN
jgi:hypothetical protein